MCVSPSHLLIKEDESCATLRPNPTSMPRITTSSFNPRIIKLEGFSLHPEEMRKWVNLIILSSFQSH